jgi:hypothetical protein
VVAYSLLYARYTALFAVLSLTLSSYHIRGFMPDLLDLRAIQTRCRAALLFCFRLSAPLRLPPTIPGYCAPMVRAAVPQTAVCGFYGFICCGWSSVHVCGLSVLFDHLRLYSMQIVKLTVRVSGSIVCMSDIRAIRGMSTDSVLQIHGADTWCRIPRLICSRSFLEWFKGTMRRYGK